MTTPQPKLVEEVLGVTESNAQIVAAEGGIILRRGPDLFIPDADLQKVAEIGRELEEEEAQAEREGKILCAQCTEYFKPRRSGGRPQRFCGEPCRRAHHAENPNASQRQQRGEAMEPNANHVESYIRRPPDYDEFDWSTCCDVIVRPRAGLAVFWNPHGDVVIRRESQRHPDEDEFVRVEPVHLAAVIAALEEKKREFEQGGAA